MNRGTGSAYSSQESDNSTSFNDMESFIDMEMFPFSGSSSANSSSTNLSRTSSSNQPTIQPSFPYDLFPQTVPPIVSGEFLPELTSGASSSLSMSSPDMYDMESQLSTLMPPFFFPESPGATVDPASILGANTVTPTVDTDFKTTYIPQPPPQFDGKRLYAGIHTQRAAYNKDLENQRRMMAQANNNNGATAPIKRESTSSASSAGEEPSFDERINRIFNNMKPPKVLASATSPGATLPHIARLKKDEEEMDEDERLLASEEGKKLSSKERRQLRNKVSARAFRSRRKEYISQLEAEVANKASEAAELRIENTQLKSEIAQLQEFTRNVLRSPAFSSFLAELEKAQPAVSNAPVEQPVSVPEPTPNYHKDPNPNLVGLGNDDWLGYGGVAGAPSWAMTPQVFSVFDLPQGPAVLQDFSGKAIRSPMEDLFDWSQLPPPVDGFSPNKPVRGVLPSVEEEVKVEGDVDMSECDESDFVPPENLSDLFAAKSGNISERIEALSPGIGLDSLLGKLEAVINGEADPSDVFGSGAGPQEHVRETVEARNNKYALVQEDGETPEQYMQRCRDVTRMFDIMETYKRVGTIVGV